MNKIESGEKLDFNHVLIRPKRSTINSRSKVSLEREFKFKYASCSWSGVPIISANMDTTGTFGVYECLKEHKIITAMHKFYTAEHYANYVNKHGTMDPNYFIACMNSKYTNPQSYVTCHRY